MIQFFTGKPGDGKSLFATRQILEDLINTDCFVVTNIPLVPSKVHEYVSARRDDFAFDDRVRVIDDSDVYEFYRIRSGGLVLPWSPDHDCEKANERLPRPEFTAAMKQNFMKIAERHEWQLPVRYYIDEAHNFFSARDWSTNGRGTLYYASQHRHLHDEICLITQVMENVEKQLRGLASETYVVRNQLRRRVGPFRLRPVFVVKSYYGVPSGPASKPYATTSFELEPARVGACYKTTGALGVFTTPEAKINKGLFPWWALPVAAFAALLLVSFLIFGAPQLALRHFFKPKEKAEKIEKVPSAAATRAGTTATTQAPATPEASAGRIGGVMVDRGRVMVSFAGEWRAVERVDGEDVWLSGGVTVPRAQLAPFVSGWRL